MEECLHKTETNSRKFNKFKQSDKTKIYSLNFSQKSLNLVTLGRRSLATFSVRVNEDGVNEAEVNEAGVNEDEVNEDGSTKMA